MFLQDKGYNGENGRTAIMLLRLFLLKISPEFNYWVSNIHLNATSDAILTKWFNDVKLKAGLTSLNQRGV